jgi:hypothetical protein
MLSMADLIELVANNGRAIITASHSTTTALVVIGQYDHQYYMTNCVAAECPVNTILSIHATVVRDMSNACQSRTKTKVLVAPLNGFGREVFEQSKGHNPTFTMKYSVLALEPNYTPPPHEWIQL